MELRREFDDRIRSKFWDHRDLPTKSKDGLDFLYADSTNGPHEIPEADDIGDYDLYLNAEVSLPHGDKVQKGTVVGRVKDKHSNIVGSYDKNPILDSRV